MMFRPRALNMIDHSVKIGEQPLNGGLMDFAIIMFNNAQKIIEKSPSYEARQDKVASATNQEVLLFRALW